MSVPAQPTARDGWRPPEEVTGTALRIGGGVPAGQGVMPISYIGVDGQPHDVLPIETATWDPAMRKHDWDLWSAQKSKGEVTTPIDFVPPNQAEVGQWTCTPIGQCQPCPDTVAHLPYCQPWGNRLEVECRRRTEVRRAEVGSEAGPLSKGWQQCGKARSVERQGFTQLVLFNTFLGALFLILFLRRQHHLAAKHSAALNERLEHH